MKVNSRLHQLLESKFLIKAVITLFFFLQIKNIFNGGTTYDTMDLRFGSHNVLDKLIMMYELDFNNSIFSNFTSTEYFGLILIFPIYIGAHIINRFTYDYVDTIFISNDSYIYFNMHLLLIIYVSLSLYFIASFLKVKYNTTKVNIFIIFLLLVPSFTGHSLFNLKDIPYLIQLFLINLFLINNYGENIQTQYSKKRIFTAAFLIALSVSIRINAYLFILFTFGLIFLKHITTKNVNKIFIIEGGISLFSSILILFLLSPQGWVRPLQLLRETFDHQFNHGWPGSTLTNGEFVIAQEVSSSYLFDWFLSRMPLFIFVGLIAFISLVITKKLKLTLYSQYSLIFVLFVFSSFPIIRPTAYDGLRHFLFVIPYLLILFTESFEHFLNRKTYFSMFYVLVIVFYSVFTQYGLGPYKYLYFNETVNLSDAAYYCDESIDGCGNWPTDYWGYKGKEVAEYINTNFEEKFSQDKLMVCKPKHTVEPYLDKEIKLTTIDDLKAGDTVFIVTYQRPRYMEDSCYFNNYKITRVCEEEFSFQQNIRQSEINLAYIAKCFIERT
ncbi:hypothetical protein OAQ50_00180 [Acidimicrobiia bacterium]|nr:hypothetical protein [Acidimicrobiia bacterium]